MKLRNKKTGKPVYVDIQIPMFNNNKVLGTYSVTSLKELNEHFEDYTPAEPLINNVLIRALVRSWAHVNNIDKVEYNYYPADDNCSFIFTYDGGMELLLDFRRKFDNLISGKTYSITELIGDDE